MLPTSVQWNCEYDSSTNSTHDHLTQPYKRISSLSLFDDDNEVQGQDEECQLQRVPLRSGADRVYTYTSKSSWECEVGVLIERGHNNRSSSSLRKMLDRAYKPETRQEAFECLRCLDDWSSDLEMESGTSDSNLSSKDQENSIKTVRSRRTQLRRRIFAEERETSSRFL